MYDAENLQMNSRIIIHSFNYIKDINRLSSLNIF